MDPITNELAHAGEQPSVTPEILELENNRITSTKVLAPMEFLFSLFNEPCFPRRELVAFTGRAKSGKTFVMSMLMVLCVMAEVLSFRRLTESKLRLLWYDTEQSDNSTQDILKNRIIPLYERVNKNGAPFPEDMFDIFNVRNLDREKREAYLIAAINYYKPDLVILDGIRDLVGDINDGTVAQELIEKLMHVAQEKDCCIVCVLHQNKSGESRDPRGWLGTELLNKAFDVFATEKLMPQRIFKLEQLYTRKYDIEQDLYFANKNQTAYEYYLDAFPQANRKEIRADLAKVGLAGELAIKPIGNLSGGEMMRLKLAITCKTPSNILILDEPTNHLDVKAKAALKTAIGNYEGALILVTHEADFAEGLCDVTFDARA